jgi:hypothetical protein
MSSSYSNKPSLQDSDDEDCEFLKQVEIFESSLIETPLSSKKKQPLMVANQNQRNLDEGLSKCLDYDDLNRVTEKTMNQDEDDDLLVNELFKAESRAAMTKLNASCTGQDAQADLNGQEDEADENIAGDEVKEEVVLKDEEAFSEEDMLVNKKYSDVLKRYFGYSTFRK